MNKVFIARGIDKKFAGELRQLAQSAGVPVQVVPREKLDRLAPAANHQGVVGLASPIDYLTLDELIEQTHVGTEDARPLLVALDRIEDTHNLGAILRSAAAFGAVGLVIPMTRNAPVDDAAVKASAGAALRLPIARVKSTAVAVEEAREAGFIAIGATARGGREVQEIDWQRPLVIVLGGEHDGLSSSVERACDELVTIGLSTAVESLNVSVAAGVLLFAARR